MEKHFVGRKKRQNGKEKETEMKDGKKKRRYGNYIRILMQKAAFKED